MRNIFRNILIASVVLTLNAAPLTVYAMPEPVPAGQTDKEKAKAAAAKKKEAEKKKKEAEKAKAAAAKKKEADKKKKEADKAKAAAARENAKKQAEKDKAAAERAKAAAEREEAKAKKEAEARAQEEKAIREYEKYQERLENPRMEPISYFNLGFRVGYAAMMDQINGSYMGAGTLNQSNVLQQLKGGAGAGIDLTYNLEYGHFLFETGLDFRFLNSTSTYGFTAIRNDLTYNAIYNYLFDNMRETRNMAQVGLPLMFGAQFNRFYFLVGAKVHYSFLGMYSQKGLYDITVNDPALIEPYGMGIYEFNGKSNAPIVFRQPDISAALELGIDLDEWLQQQADPKKKVKVKPGERLPFGREHVHYRLSFFAEYGVLNSNATPKANPVEFAANQVEVQNGNTFLAMNGDTKLNNLFVGVKFTIQFEVPGKTIRPVTAPPSVVYYTVVDERTNQPIEATLTAKNTETDKVVVASRPVPVKGLKQKHELGSYVTEVSANGYYSATQEYSIEKVGSKEYLTIALRPRPVFRVRVTNKETGEVVPATVQIRANNSQEPAYSLATDSISGTAGQMLAEGPQYSLHVAQMGYDTVDMIIPSIGDSLNVELTPIKKGEIFIVKNLFFATNKTRILSTSEEALNDLYMYLARNPQVRIKIIGHTDSVGKDEANQKLSEGRANEVMKDLIERGIAPERLEAEGRGETQPIDTNDTDEGRQNNRRVEIEIL